MQMFYNLARERIYEMVDKQLESNDPPVARRTFDRLMAEGLSPLEARRQVAAALAFELDDMTEGDRPFSDWNYHKQLEALPYIPPPEHPPAAPPKRRRRR